MKRQHRKGSSARLTEPPGDYKRKTGGEQRRLTPFVIQGGGREALKSMIRAGEVPEGIGWRSRPGQKNEILAILQGNLFGRGRKQLQEM